MSGLFGGTKKSTTNQTQVETITHNAAPNLRIYGPDGAVSGVTNTGDGGFQSKTVFGPDVGRFTDSFAKNSQDALSRLESNIQALQGNTNAYIKARVDPLQASLDSQLAQNERDYARRGIFGSISQNATNDFNSVAQQQLGNARAQALNESLSAILANEAQARGVNSDIAQAANMKLQQELAGMGLSMDALHTSLGDQFVTGGTTNTKGVTKSTDGSSILGKVLGAAAIAAAPFTGGASLAAAGPALPGYSGSGAGMIADLKGAGVF